MSRDGTLRDKIAVVTGGRGGIGRAVCARFAREGARVYAADLAEGARELPDGVSFAKLDVTREDQVGAVIAEIGAGHGRLDILVNAAGIEIEKTIEDTSLEEWNRIFAINVTGTFLVSKYALP
ncbi:MAG: SDR family NAD(P)-dependent oxidoreductase, partial [Kiloniellales bacterium]|nr:SDR family NAD(P)-dependent oxidoreductase [Kiloniellales bacterium]